MNNNTIGGCFPGSHA